MPYSSHDGKDFTRTFLRNAFPKGANVLDVGPGAGAYRDLLPVDFVMDALEIFEPYVARFGLRERYREVVVGDASVTRLSGPYDVVVAGDVLEHMTVAQAASFLSLVRSYAGSILLSVPWLWKQGPSEGNEAEAHQQDDLTPGVMRSRYPSLKPVYEGPIIGVYWEKFS